MPDPTREEALAHHGVLGMKWGRTRVRASSSDIRDARVNLGVKKAAYAKQQSTANKTKDAGKRAAELKKLSDMKADFLKDPDRVTASRLTRGEKAVAIVLGAGTPIGVAVIAGSSAASRRIEQKQDTGAYDKKK